MEARIIDCVIGFWFGQWPFYYHYIYIIIRGISFYYWIIDNREMTGRQGLREMVNEMQQSTPAGC